MKQPICMQPDEPNDLINGRLGPMLRIDYSRVYTVEHNVKAMAFGFVHRDSKEDFMYSFKAVFFPEDEGGDEEEDEKNDDDDVASYQRRSSAQQGWSKDLAHSHLHKQRAPRSQHRHQ